MKLLLSAAIKEYMLKISVAEARSLLSNYMSSNTEQRQYSLEKPLDDILRIYNQAWPILIAIKEHGAKQLINILEQAPPDSLKAFSEITTGTLLHEVVTPFLFENLEELVAFDRANIIQFLSRVDLNQWVSDLVDAFTQEATQFFSIQILMHSFTPGDDKNYYLKDITGLLDNNELGFTSNSLSVIVNYYIGVQANCSPDVLGQIDELLAYFLQHSNLEQQVQFIRELSKEALLNLIKHLLTPFDEKQELAVKLLPLLCSEWIVANPTYLKEIRLQLELNLATADPFFDQALEAIPSSAQSSNDSAFNTKIAVLLQSPLFISGCSPEMLRLLSNRYRLYCLSLSDEEFRKSDFFTAACLQFTEINNPAWPNNKAQLIQRRADLCEKATLTQLESLSFNHSAIDAQVANQALTSLYLYYSDESKPIDNDLYLRIIAHFYSKDLLSKCQQTPQSPQYIQCLEKLLLSARQPIAGSHLVIDKEFNGKLLHYILYGISEWSLSIYPSVFDMVLRQNISDSSIATVYDSQVYRRGAFKLPWLERQLTRVLTGKETFTVHSLRSLFQVLREEYAFELLGIIKDKPLATELFDCILLNKEWRNHFLLNLYASDVHQYFKQQDPVACLASCLLNYYRYPWFFDLIKRFNYYGNKTNQPLLLIDALSLIAKDSTNDPTKAKALHGLLLRFIQSESGIDLLLNEFNKYEKAAGPFPEEPPEIIHFFNKKHLIAAIKQANKASDMGDSKQYSLIVYLLAKNHDALFQSGRGDFDMRNVFTDKELAILIAFTTKQLQSLSTDTTHNLVAYRVLGDLLFRSARKGLTELFYSNHVFNPALARKAIMMPYFISLIYKFWLPDEAQANSPHTRSWMDETRSMESQLREFPLLYDLFQLSKQNWKRGDAKQLPIICVFLLSYTGEKEPLMKLLNDYIQYFKKNKFYLHILGRILSMYPNHPVSSVIYEALENAMFRYPELLDMRLLNHMSDYHCQQIEDHNESKPLVLLKYWGRDKQYVLVEEACNLLIAHENNYKSLLSRIRKEAGVENQINLLQKGFPFNLIKYLLRWWHYGLHPENTRSQYIQFCDEESPSEKIKTLSGVIGLSIDNDKQLSQKNTFAERRKQFFKLLNTIASGPRSHPSALTLSDKQQGFFGLSSPDSNNSEVIPVESQKLRNVSEGIQISL